MTVFWGVSPSEVAERKSKVSASWRVVRCRYCNVVADVTSRLKLSFPWRESHVADD
jgi:hypothetical protein